MLSRHGQSHIVEFLFVEFHTFAPSPYAKLRQYNVNNNDLRLRTINISCSCAVQPAPWPTTKSVIVYATIGGFLNSRWSADLSSVFIYCQASAAGVLLKPRRILHSLSVL